MFVHKNNRSMTVEKRAKESCPKYDYSLTNLVLNKQYNINSSVCKDRTKIALVKVSNTDCVTS